MIQINLLPSGSAARPQTRSRPIARLPKIPQFGGNPLVAGLGAVGVLVALTFAFLFWKAGAREADLRVQIEEAVTDSVRLSSTIELVQSLRAREDTITQKIAVIKDVDDRRFVWPHLLDEVSKSVPAFTWLSSITSTQPADSGAVGPALTLQGNAGSTQALTRFMKNLEASPFMRAVTLVTSEQVTEESRTFQRFTLEAQYEVPAEQAIETVPVVVIN